jgi:hypothetical protein
LRGRDKVTVCVQIACPVRRGRRIRGSLPSQERIVLKAGGNVGVQKWWYERRRWTATCHSSHKASYENHKLAHTPLLEYAVYELRVDQRSGMAHMWQEEAYI